MPVLLPDTDDPDCSDYTLNSGSCWITVNTLSIHIVQTDECVAVDIFPLEQEMEDPITTAWASFSEKR